MAQVGALNGDVFFQEWIDGVNIESTRQDEHEAGDNVAWNLYVYIVQFFHKLLPFIKDSQTLPETSKKELLQAQRKLAIWGDGLQDDKLETALEAYPDLRTSVMLLLEDLGTALVKGIWLREA